MTELILYWNLNSLYKLAEGYSSFEDFTLWKKWCFEVILLIFLAVQSVSLCIYICLYQATCPFHHVEFCLLLYKYIYLILYTLGSSKILAWCSHVFGGNVMDCTMYIQCSKHFFSSLAAYFVEMCWKEIRDILTFILGFN